MAVSFLGSLGQSFTIIFLSELADRTFILVLIYASKLSWMPLLLTGLLSMGLMNILAITVGYLVPLLIVKGVVDWIGFFCFLLFGIFSINESINMESTSVHDEMIKQKEEDEKSYKMLSDNENNNSNDENKGTFSTCLELFWFLCLSELGDKSEITTIAIAALYNFYGVLCGTMIAYFCTIIIATFLGNVLSHYISEKQMNLIGGIIFLLFALEILLVKYGII